MNRHAAMEPARAPMPVAAAETLLILAIFFVAAGDPTPGVNEQHYLTRLKHFWQPSWCAGDLFLESPDAHFTIVWLIGWTTRLAPLPAVAWAGRLLTWGLLAWVWQRLSWAIVPRRFAAVGSAGLWLTGMLQGHLAGEWVVGGVEAKGFAYVFVLLALTAYVEDRWRAVWVHLGIATALHALVGGWSTLILLALWLLHGRAAAPIRTLLPSLALGGAIGLAGVAPPVVMNWSTPPDVVAEANQIYVFQRLPHHLAPLSKPADWLAERAGRHAVMLALLIGAAWWAPRQRDPVGQRLRRVIGFAGGAMLLMLIGLAIESAFAAQPARAASLLRYYWHRLTDIAAPMAVALTATQAIQVGIAAKRPVGVVGLALSLAVTAWGLAGPLGARLADRRAPADKSVANPADWRDACQWVRANTPRDAVFLTPRYANSFKWRAHRAEVANWKDIPQDAASMVAWRRRVRELAYHPADESGLVRRARSLGHLGGPRLRELGRAYGASYALTNLRRPAGLPIAYSNATYVVYELAR